MPNSARDLLAVLQPATKALAQVLAGRSNPSGQLAHAQAVLAHAERLIGERAHNRLNPHEREEFFEQLARLRLTLSDADSEAEVVAAEEQEARPPAPPVDQERLRALALALSTPLAAADEGSARGVQADAAPEQVADTPGQVEDVASTNGAEEGAPAEDDAPPAASKLSAANARSGRLQLSRSGDENASAPPAVHQIRRNRSRTKPVAHGAEPPPLAPNGHTTGSSELAEGGQGAEGGGAGPTEEGYPVAGGDDTKPRKRTRRRKTAAGVPEGWVIDEDGFVVPGPQ